ncbi:hypothetical protein CDEST_02926 [Colletotrichum destructivum]|uniref:Uncharacterized protein n=1 Tax=Colletotrichum destructivum TaxID=34406 RepID=A0AAX4I444_9PEZI|nr:hypothetical protein CDEST_02926 [Colletotrichum destructivum]
MSRAGPDRGVIHIRSPRPARATRTRHTEAPDLLPELGNAMASSPSTPRARQDALPHYRSISIAIARSPRSAPEIAFLSRRVASTRYSEQTTTSNKERRKRGTKKRTPLTTSQPETTRRHLEGWRAKPEQQTWPQALSQRFSLFSNAASPSASRGKGGEARPETFVSHDAKPTNNGGQRARQNQRGPNPRPPASHPGV